MCDLYAVLGVPRDADDREIRKAYHRAAMMYHPDKQAGRVDMFLKVVDAFTVLSNESSRVAYDRDLQIREASLRSSSEAREAMIESLKLRESGLAGADPLEVYRQDLRSALEKVQPARQGKSFEEYERVILAALIK